MNYKWLSVRRKAAKASIDPGMLEGKPILGCGFYNYFGDESITINECHLIVDGQLSPIPVSKNLPLPITVPVNNGVAFYFDPLPIVTRAREVNQGNFKARALFRDSAGRTYLSKSITIPTDSRLYIRIFEDVSEHLSTSVKATLDIAQAIAEQLDQQFVKIPHIVLALVREQSGVSGYVLRNLGLDEDFLLNLAQHTPNMPRDRAWAIPHQDMEVQDLLDEFMAGEGRKMRQRCFGTGDLLLGLTRQKHEEFTVILDHLKVQPEELRTYIYDALRKDQNQADHPTLPPEGLKRYIWSIWYQITHALFIIFWRVIERLFPDIEI